MVSPSVFTRKIIGLKVGMGKVRRFAPSIRTWPLGPRSVISQNSSLGSLGPCQRSLPVPPSEILRSLVTLPGSTALWKSLIAMKGKV